MHVTEFQGRWEDLPARIPDGELSWLAPAKAGLQTHTATVAGKPVAAIRTQLFKRGFTVTVPG